MQRVAPANHEGPRAARRQKPRLWMNQARHEERNRKHIGETQKAEIPFAQQGPQELHADRNRQRIVEVVQRPTKPDHKSGERAGCREIEEPTLFKRWDTAVITAASPAIRPGRTDTARQRG
jgi:hypothetical protein